MRHTYSVLVENHPGVLARIAGLFSARGFNIDSLAVGETEDPTMSRMTIVVNADERTLEQVKKQLNKLIDTIIVKDLHEGEFIGRELMLIKVASTSKNKGEIIETAETLGGRVVHAATKTITVELVGDEDKIKSALELFEPFGIKEVVRTGRIAISKE